MIDDKNLMKDDMVSKLAILLSHDKKISSIAEALDIVVNSETYQRLMDDKTALYYQSPRYVYTFLMTELTTGKVGQTLTNLTLTVQIKRKSVGFSPDLFSPWHNLGKLELCSSI